MPAFVPILIGAAILGGAFMLSKRSGAAPMPAPPPSPPAPPGPPGKEVGNIWVALTRAQIAATHPYEVDAPTEISPKIAIVKPGSYVHVFFRNTNPSVPGEWGVLIKITGGPHFVVEGEGAGVYWSGVVSAENTKPGGPTEGSTVNDFPSQAILRVSEPVGATGVSGPFFPSALAPYPVRPPLHPMLTRHLRRRGSSPYPSPYDPYGRSRSLSPYWPYGHRR
jgi:hypothetical protein